MTTHFERLMEKATPRATRLVKVMGGLDTCDDDDKQCELPTSMSKRSCYCNFCHERGWVIQFDAKGVVSSKEETNVGEGQPIPSWTTYYKFWANQYKDLLIRKPSEDICGECWCFANAFRSRHKKMEHLKRRLNDDHDMYSSDEESQSDSESDNATTDFSVQVELAMEQLHQHDIELGKEIARAHEHVTQYTRQREQYQTLIKESKQSYTANMQRSDQVFTFTADYSQGMPVPSFNLVQPGETYYYSEAIGNIFGIVDSSGKDGNEHLLTAYFYMEGDAKKGGNNVASMLIDYLHRKGLTDSNNTVKSINFVFDNCAGQNKNKMVLWVLLYIVRMKWAFNAQAHFLIRGHTKNTCDRLFNLLNGMEKM